MAWLRGKRRGVQIQSFGVPWFLSYHLSLSHMVPTRSTRTERETGKNRPEMCSILRDSFRLLCRFLAKEMRGYPVVLLSIGPYT